MGIVAIPVACRKGVVFSAIRRNVWENGKISRWRDHQKLCWQQERRKPPAGGYLADRGASPSRRDLLQPVLTGFLDPLVQCLWRVLQHCTNDAMFAPFCRRVEDRC